MVPKNLENVIAFVWLLQNAFAISLDPNDPESIRDAASTVAYGMVSIYNGNTTGQTPGLLPAPYSFYDAGFMWDTLIDYWYYTGDATYNDITTEALLVQASSKQDFMPVNQTDFETNAGQTFWGFAAISAAEYRFPNPPKTQPAWIELAEGVWNSQQRRWDTNACGGGLYQEIIAGNRDPAGTPNDPKDTLTNAGFLSLGARLYAYTENSTYAQWTSKTWNWLVTENVLVHNKTGYFVFGGLSNVPIVSSNCSGNVDYSEWTDNTGRLLLTAAIMYNKTNDVVWQERAIGIWQFSQIFFRNHIMFEKDCEPENNCATHTLSAKGEFARSLAASTKWMPQFNDEFLPYLQASAVAAASQCSGTWDGLQGNACGYHWDTSTWDGSSGTGQQISALQVIQANLISAAPYPVTEKNGGISKPRPVTVTQTTDSNVQTRNSLSIGVRIGIGVSVAMFALALFVGLLWLIIHRKRKQRSSRDDNPVPYLDEKAELPDHRAKRAQIEIVELASEDRIELNASDRQELSTEGCPAQLDNSCALHELHGNWSGHEMKA